MSQRNVEHQGLELLLFARAFREDREVAHHLQTVGDLDHRHTRVSAVLDYQALVVLGFEPGVLGLDGTDLVEAVHEGKDILGKGGDIGLRVHPRGFVEVDCRDTFFGQAYFVTYYRGHTVGVSDKRFSVVAEILCKRGKSHLACSFDKVFHLYV